MKLLKGLRIFASALAVTAMVQFTDVAYAYDYSADQQVVLNEMNNLRARSGARALVFDDVLTAAADKRAREIAQSFSHTRPDGRNCFTVLREFKVHYNNCGENIAYGTEIDGHKVYDMWDNSPGHHANMVGKQFTRVGIGFYREGNNNYWVQLFADGKVQASSVSASDYVDIDEDSDVSQDEDGDDSSDDDCWDEDDDDDCWDEDDDDDDWLDEDDEDYEDDEDDWLDDDDDDWDDDWDDEDE